MPKNALKSRVVVQGNGTLPASYAEQRNSSANVGRCPYQSSAFTLQGKCCGLSMSTSTNTKSTTKVATATFLLSLSFSLARVYSTPKRPILKPDSSWISPFRASCSKLQKSTTSDYCQYSITTRTAGRDRCVGSMSLFIVDAKPNQAM